MSEDLSPRERAARQVFTRADWERGLNEGWLTRQEVDDRLFRLALHEFGDQDEDGYDDEGFFVSLTAAGLRVNDSVTLRVWSNDHEPPHVHVERRGKQGFRLYLDTAEVYGELPGGVKSKELQFLQAALLENREELGEWWRVAMGDPVTRVHD
jgi:hypothetical protein